MRFVLSLAVACFAIGLAGARSATAQYPIYAPQSYGYAQPSYGQVDYRDSHHGHHSSHHSHYGHQRRPSTSPYYSGYGAQYPRSGGYPPAVSVPPVINFPPAYGAGAVYAQPVPQNPIYYSTNNYYGSQNDALHHPWHPGHYLLGHH